MTLKPNLKCTAEQVADAVCKACGITLHQLIYAPKKLNVNIARGMYCAITVMTGIHPSAAADYIKRSRVNVITSAKHYKGYLEVKDDVTTKLYEKIVGILQDEHTKD